MKNFPINTGEDGIAINVTAVSAATLISSSLVDVIREDVMIDNPGPNDVTVAAGDASVVATDLSMRVPANSLQPFRKGTANYLAFKCKAGLTQQVIVHVGEGA